MEPRTTQVTRHLKYQFSQAERNDLASELANAYYDRSELESQLASIKADFKGRIGAIETQIEKHTRRIRDGYEMREIECEVQFHRPEDGMKRVVRLDTGEEVAVEYMLPHERQEILPFVETPQAETPQAEEVSAEIAEEEAQPEPAEESAWPQPNANGVYEQDVEPALQWSSKDRKMRAMVYALQLADGWISCVEFGFGDQIYTGVLADTCPRFPHRNGAIYDAVETIERALWERLQSEIPLAKRKQLAPLSKLVDRWAMEHSQDADEAIEHLVYPQPNDHGVYRKSEALSERINVDNRRYARVYVLQIGQKLIGDHQVPEFIAAVDWQLGEGGHSEALSRPTAEKYIYGSIAAAFRAALGRLAEGMNSFIAPERPRPDVKAASKIADWAENLAKTKYGPQGAGELDPDSETE